MLRWKHYQKLYFCWQHSSITRILNLLQISVLLFLFQWWFIT